MRRRNLMELLLASAQLSRSVERSAAYRLQLYFDFSGYSQTAIVTAPRRVRLPLNFELPYKVTNIIYFWRRRHMTLSRFLP